MIDGEKAVNDKVLKFKVTKSCTIEPIYEEDNAKPLDDPNGENGGEPAIIEPAKEYDVTIVRAYKDTPERETIHTSHAKLEYKANSKELFIGWYTTVDGEKTLLSTEYKYEFDVTENIIINEEVLILKDKQWILELYKDDEQIEYLSLALEDEIDLNDLTFKLTDYDTKEEYQIGEELLKGERKPVNYFICDTADYESISDFNPLSFKTVKTIDTTKKGAYIVVFYVGDYYFSSIMNEVYDFIVVFVDYTEDEIIAGYEIINQNNN